jgi:hypothetical protein
MRHSWIGVIIAWMVWTHQVHAQEFTGSSLEVKQTIDRFFQGFHQRDSVAMKSVMHPDLVLQTVLSRQDQTKLVVTQATDFLHAVATRENTPVWEERLHQFQISVDGAMAQAWVEYSFWMDGNFSHCGVDAFALFKSDQGWQITYLADTRRTVDCGPYDE